MILEIPSQSGASWPWSLRFFVPVVPRRRRQRQPVLMPVDAFLDPCTSAPDFRGHKAVHCYSTVDECIFKWGLCREVPSFLVIFNDVMEKRTCMSLFWGLAQLWMLESYCGAAQ